MKKQLLLLVMILAFANIPNYAQTVVNVNDLRFQIENGNAIVGRQDRELSGDIVIPSSIDYEGQTYSVTGIVGPIDTHSYGGMSSISADEAAFQGTAITSVTLPTTITNINTCAFINCSYLQKVVLPEGITSIGWGAFAYCSSLTEINLPNSLQSLSAWSFGGCSSLKSINIPENITNLPDAVFKNCGFESFDIPAQITRLGRESLNMYGLKSVKSYIRDITRIYYHDECFGNVTDKTLYIPNGSRFIYQEYNPWRKFATIEEFDDGHTGEPINPIELIATVNDIRYKIFDDGTAILIQQNESLSGEIVIPETITVGEKSYTVNGIIGPNDTQSWGNMNSISADGAAFQGTAITSITLPTTISNINTCAFINCSKLQKVVLPETITSIGWGAFAYCSSLTEINLPNSLQSLSAWAFAGCRELKQIAIPKQITTLPSACFKESGLNYIDIPENVVSMQNLCLNTSSLSYVKIYQSDINLIWTSDNAFGTYDNIQNTDLFVPRGCKTNYIQTYPWAKFRSIDEFGFIVNIDNNDGGKITASKTIVLYNDEKIRLTISPNTGYSLESLSINGIDVTKDIVNGEYIVSDINEDLNIVGVFIINKYKLTYTVDGEEYKSSEVEYGATITAEEAPTKEGYTFSGWSDIPKTMPANDVTVTGTFTINKYKLTYYVDGVEYKSYELEYGASITPEAEPTKEGYTFSGWSSIPKTMPANDVTVSGTFSKGSFKLIYMVDGAVYKTINYDYGDAITPESEPSKEGYTFSGWSDIPSTMPANDVTVTGTFTINKYKLIYYVNGVEYKSYDVEYGTTITPEAAPTKEGYTFSGWSDIPSTMPANDFTVTGIFTINKYKLIYYVDGEEYKSYEIEYGASITPEAEPTKEGYTFSGWSSIPKTMPANDVTVFGTFSKGSFKLIYMVDGAVYKTINYDYGDAITPESEPTKEGYTFSGWSKIPQTMPANDVTVTGTFTINKYKLTYYVDGVEYKSYDVEYGASITVEEAPTKEGYTFSGWSWIPTKMPSEDVIVTGTFTVNKYKLTYMVDGEVYKTFEVEYGATITPEPAPNKEGYDFSGWDNVPETMPAHDVTVNGSLTVGITDILMNSGEVKIFDMKGNQIGK